jgi:hypothetical protein
MIGYSHLVLPLSCVFVFSLYHIFI